MKKVRINAQILHNIVFECKINNTCLWWCDNCLIKKKKTKKNIYRERWKVEDYYLT